MSITKEEWRKLYLKKRRLLTENDWHLHNQQLTQQALLLVEKIQPRFIHTFLPIRRNKEPDTFRIMQAIQVAYPFMQWVVPSMVADSYEMHHYLLNDTTVLQENKWGVEEPDPATTVQIDPIQIDLVFTPLLVIDSAGYRIGYGGGYYDRFFPQCRPDVFKVGVSLFPPIDSLLPKEAFDIPLDFCITPDNIWSFK